MVKVVMAGGGTAGHVNPLLATAAQLRESGAEVVVWGQRLVWNRIWFRLPVSRWWRFLVCRCRVALPSRSSRCRRGSLMR